MNEYSEEFVDSLYERINSLSASLKEKDETLRELQNKLAEAEVDAERYRFAKGNKSCGIIDIVICRVDWKPGSTSYSILCGDAADMEIDAAIQQAKRGEG